jgi:hypothetical protein
MHISAINLASATANATPAATATLTPTPTPTRFFKKNKDTLKLTCWMTSSNRGTTIPTTTHLTFSLGFKRTWNLVALSIFKMPTLVQISPTATGLHLISIPLYLGHLNMTMFLVSFLLSVGEAGIGRSAGRIAYFDYT